MTHDHTFRWFDDNNKGMASTKDLIIHSDCSNNNDEGAASTLHSNSNNS